MLRRLGIAIRNNTLVGFFLTVPIVATVVIFRFLLKLMTDNVADFLHHLLH